jgi:hypothetical protein
MKTDTFSNNEKWSQAEGEIAEEFLVSSGVVGDVSTTLYEEFADTGKDLIEVGRIHEKAVAACESRDFRGMRGSLKELARYLRKRGYLKRSA